MRALVKDLPTEDPSTPRHVCPLLAAALGGLALLASALGAQNPNTPDATLVARARAIHQSVITIDTHVDIEASMGTPEADPLTYNHQVNLTKMKAGGLDVAFFAVFVGQGARTDSGNARAKAAALAKFEAVHRTAERMYPNLIEIAYSPADVVRIHKSGKLVAAIGIENGYVIGRDLSLIQGYYDMGARYMTLAHTSNNDICDSSTDRNGAEHHGLSAFGRQVVAEMNRVGIMVDISHVSKECMMQATALSKAPVIGSHSSTCAVASVPRNMDDEMLRAIQKNNGVIQIVAFASYVTPPIPARDSALNALRQEFGIGAAGGGAGRGAGGRGGAAPASTCGYSMPMTLEERAADSVARGQAAAARGAAGGGGRAGRGGAGGGRPDPLAGLSDEQRAAFQKRLDAIDARWPPADVRQFVNHIDHAVKLIGIDHVGISSDMDGGGGVRGYNDASEAFNVTLELVRRGYSEEQIRKLWGGNTMWVWGDAPKVALRLQSKS